MNTADARKSVRQRKFLGATIQCNRMQTVFDCTIKNLSEEGAFLKMESIVGIPRNFNLYVPNLNENFQCTVVWNTMTELGVSFKKSRPASGRNHLRLVQ